MPIFKVTAEGTETSVCLTMISRKIFFYAAEVHISLPFSKYLVFLIEPQKIILYFRKLDCEFSSAFLLVTYLAKLSYKLRCLTNISNLGKAITSCV